jgi:uncharacterized protein YdhG (YjbR/CyaY superfamily)
MSDNKKKNKSVDDYISGLAPEIQSVVNRVRLMVKTAAPESIEKLSYGIPAFEQKRIILWFGAFKDHFSLFPPIMGDDALALEAKPFANDKGNLIFPYSNHLPFELIQKVIIQKVHQNEMRINPKTKKQRNL